MRAIVQDAYGLPDVLELQEIDKPDVTDDEVLVRVRAASVNPADWHSLTGTPYIARLAFGLLKPKRERLGVDFAGTVEVAGRNVKSFNQVRRYSAREAEPSPSTCVFPRVEQ